MVFCIQLPVTKYFTILLRETYVPVANPMNPNRKIREFFSNRNLKESHLTSIFHSYIINNCIRLMQDKVWKDCKIFPDKTN